MDNNLPTECCAKCWFAAPLDCDDPPIVAVCRRFPPLFFSGFGQRTGDDMSEDNWHRPTVTLDDWCGEFQRVPEVHPEQD